MFLLRWPQPLAACRAARAATSALSAANPEAGSATAAIATDTLGPVVLCTGAFRLDLLQLARELVPHLDRALQEAQLLVEDGDACSPFSSDRLRSAVVQALGAEGRDGDLRPTPAEGRGSAEEAFRAPGLISAAREAQRARLHVVLDNRYCHPSFDLPTQKSALREAENFLWSRWPCLVLVGIPPVGGEDALAELACMLQTRAFLNQARLAACGPLIPASRQRHLALTPRPDPRDLEDRELRALAVQGALWAVPKRRLRTWTTVLASRLARPVELGVAAACTITGLQFTGRAALVTTPTTAMGASGGERDDTGIDVPWPARSSSAGSSSPERSEGSAARTSAATLTHVFACCRHPGFYEILQFLAFLPAPLTVTFVHSVPMFGPPRPPPPSPAGYPASSSSSGAPMVAHSGRRCTPGLYDGEAGLASLRQGAPNVCEVRYRLSAPTPGTGSAAPGGPFHRSSSFTFPPRRQALHLWLSIWSNNSRFVMQRAASGSAGGRSPDVVASAPNIAAGVEQTPSSSLSEAATPFRLL